MKVIEIVCENNDPFFYPLRQDILTVGKIYQMIPTNETNYKKDYGYITGDNGKQYLINLKLNNCGFITLKQHRENQLKLIGI